MALEFGLIHHHGLNKGTGVRSFWAGGANWEKVTRKNMTALAGVALWIEHQTMNQKVSGSIPGQGACLGCRPDPQLGACERQ